MNSIYRKLLIAFTLVIVVYGTVTAQETRFNTPLDKYCKTIISEKFRSVTPERKALLDGIAHELARKKYILFTCKTNSRRTVLLQVWAQTSFYYYGVLDKNAFSKGDTITDVYPGVVRELRKSGFYCTKQQKVEPDRYVVSISEYYPLNLLSSKDELGTIDTAKGVIVNICTDNEHAQVSGVTRYLSLPFQSPASYEKTPKESGTYKALNHKIAVEMLYLAKRVKEIKLTEY